MAKNKISEWSSTASNNTDIGGIDIAEGCAPSGINNGIRELMAQVKDMQSGADGDNFTVGGNLSVTGTTTLTGDVTAPTQLSTDNSTKVATTAFVQNKTSSLGTMSTQNANSVAITGGTMAGTFTGNLIGNVTGNVTGNVSGTLIGTIESTTVATTQAISDNSTKVATTAFVQSKVGTLGTMASQNANNVNITGGSTSVGYSYSDRFYAGNGSAASPSFVFYNDGSQDTGLYWGGDGYINFTNNGVYSGQFTPNHDFNVVGNVNATAFGGNGGSLTGVLNNTSTWYNNTGSRAMNTTYTNTTGKPMPIYVLCTSTSTAAIILTVNGLAFQGNSAISNQGLSFTVIVPNGGTYRASVTSGTPTLSSFYEMY